MTLQPLFLTVIDHFLDAVQFSEDKVTVDMRDVLSEGVTADSLGTVLQNLKNNGCFPIKTHATKEAFWTAPLRCFTEQCASVTLEKDEINTMKLYEQKQSLLGKVGAPIIKPIALEHIARKMTQTDSARGLNRMLRDCEIPFYLNLSSNTKGGVMVRFLCLLATSSDETNHRLLFRILEEFCHPLHYGGDKERAQEMQDFIADLICYDNYYFNGGAITKADPSDPEQAMWLQGMELDREQRKKERKKQEAQGLAGMTQLFDHYTQRATQVRAEEAQQRKEARVAQQRTGQVKGVYTFNELRIDLPNKLLRNTIQNVERDIAGVNYIFISTLIDGKGSLVPYRKIAESLREHTVATLTDKDVMDRKSSFVKMLKGQLKISVATCDALIGGKGGYRINGKLYE